MGVNVIPLYVTEAVTELVGAGPPTIESVKMFPEGMLAPVKPLSSYVT